MRFLLPTAAGITVLTTLVHIFLGGPEVHDPLLASNAPDIAKAVGSVVWHATTAILAINGAALFVAVGKPALRQAITALISAQFLAFAGLFIAYGLDRFGSLWPMPQWIVFLLVPALLLPVWQKSGGVEAERG